MTAFPDKDRDWRCMCDILELLGRGTVEVSSRRSKAAFTRFNALWRILRQLCGRILHVRNVVICAHGKCMCRRGGYLGKKSSRSLGAWRKEIEVLERATDIMVNFSSKRNFLFLDPLLENKTSARFRSRSTSMFRHRGDTLAICSSNARPERRATQSSESSKDRERGVLRALESHVE